MCSMMKVTVDEVITPEYRKVYPGDGFISRRDKSRGDLIVEFDIVFPKSFTPEEKQQLALGPLSKQTLDA